MKDREPGSRDFENIQYIHEYHHLYFESGDSIMAAVGVVGTAAGAAVISDPEKVLRTLKAIREERNAYLNEIRDLGQSVVQGFEAVQDYFRAHGASPDDSALFYKDAGYNDPALTLRRGDKIPSLKDFHFQSGVAGLGWTNWNDEISSVKILKGTVAACYEHTNYGGQRLLLVGELAIPELRHFHDGFWFDKISSVIVLSVHDDMDQIFPGG